MSSAQVFEIAFQLGATINSNMRSAFNNATNQLSNLESQSDNANNSMKILAAGVATATAAIGGLTVGLGAAVRAADEYDSSMKQIQASTGKSAKEMKEMREMSKNLYNDNLGEDWNDLAESISTAKSVTGLSGKALEDATSNAIVYRDVWGEEVSQSIKATDTMMKNFGINSNQAYNLMAQGAQRGLNKSDELIDSANEYAPYFATLGFSANQMFDVFSTGLKNGAFNLDKVGDAVKEFGIRSKDGSKASIEAYEALGMSGEKMTKTFAKGGPAAQKAFNQVVEAIKNVKDPAEQNAIAVSLFGTQAEDLEMKVITSMANVRSQYDMTKNTMEEVKKIKYDTLGMAIQGIGRQIETGILIPIGEKLLPLLNNFANQLAGLPKFYKENEDTIKGTIAVLAGLATAILVYQGSLLAVSVAQTAFNVIQKVSIALYHAHRAAMIAYALYGGGVKGVIMGLVAATRALNISMAANPFLLVASLLAGLAVAFVVAYKSSETFRNKVNNSFSSVKGIVKTSVDFIKSASLNVWGKFLNVKEQLVPKIQQGFSETKQKVGQFIANLGSGIADFLGEGFINGAKSLGAGFVEQLKAGFSDIPGLISLIAPTFTAIGLSLLGVSGPIGFVIASVVGLVGYLYRLSKTNEDVRNALFGAWTGIKNIISSVITSLKPIFDVFAQSFSLMATQLAPEFQKTGFVISQSIVQLQPAFQQLGAAFGELFSTIAQIIPTLLPLFVQLFQGWMQVSGTLWSSIIQIATAVLPMLLQAFQQIIPMVLSIVQGILPIVVNLLQILIPVVLKIAQAILPLILQAAQMIFPMILAIVQMVLPIIVNLLQILIPVVLQIAQVVLPLILQVAQAVFPMILSIIQMIIPIIVNLLQLAANIITTILVPAIQFFLKIVQFVFPLIMTLIQNSIAIVTGIIKTASAILRGDWSAAWSAIKDTAVTIMNNIIGFFKSINLVDSGKNIIQGLIDGIGSMAEKAKGAVVSLGNSLLSGTGKMVNGVIKGLNWVMGKVGVDLVIKEWSVPQYAKGTSSHPGGLAILGDGGGPELYRTPQGHMGLSPGTDTLMNLPKGTQVIPAGETKTILNSLNIPAYKNGNVVNALKTGYSWVKEGAGKAIDGIKGAAGKVKDVALDVWSYISEPKKLFNKVLEKLGVGFPDISGVFGDIGKNAFSMVKEKAIEFVKGKIGDFGSVGNINGVAAPDQVKAWVTKALNITNTPLTWLPSMLVKAQKESGFNPRAINLWDINAERGIPSKGLFQTIDPTFNAYKMQGMNDIYNPIHNAVAAIRYIKSRYGTVFNTPGIKSMARGGGYKGYYKGGKVPNSQWAWVGEQGPELVRLNGGTRVFPNEKSNSILSGLFSFLKDPIEGQRNNRVVEKDQPIQFVYNPQIKIEGNADEKKVQEALKMTYEEFKNFIKQYEKDKKRLSFN